MRKVIPLNPEIQVGEPVRVHGVAMLVVRVIRAPKGLARALATEDGNPALVHQRCTCGSHPGEGVRAADLVTEGEFLVCDQCRQLVSHSWDGSLW